MEAPLRATLDELRTIVAAMERDGVEEAEIYRADTGNLKVRVPAIVTRTTYTNLPLSRRKPHDRAGATA